MQYLNLGERPLPHNPLSRERLGEHLLPHNPPLKEAPGGGAPPAVSH